MVSDFDTCWPLPTRVLLLTSELLPNFTFDVYKVFTLTSVDFKWPLTTENNQVFYSLRWIQVPNMKFIQQLLWIYCTYQVWPLLTFTEMFLLSLRWIHIPYMDFFENSIGSYSISKPKASHTHKPSPSYRFLFALARNKKLGLAVVICSDDTGS